jgi:hypothetical protein
MASRERRCGTSAKSSSTDSKEELLDLEADPCFVCYVKSPRSLLEDTVDATEAWLLLLPLSGPHKILRGEEDGAFAFAFSLLVFSHHGPREFPFSASSLKKLLLADCRTRELGVDLETLMWWCCSSTRWTTAGRCSGCGRSV